MLGKNGNIIKQMSCPIENEQHRMFGERLLQIQRRGHVLESEYTFVDISNWPNYLRFGIQRDNKYYESWHTEIHGFPANATH